MRSFGFHIAVAGFAIGIAYQFLSPHSWEHGAFTALVGICLWTVWWRGVASVELTASRPLVAIFLIFCGLGMVRAWHAERPSDSPLVSQIGETVELEGIVVRDPELTPNGQRFILETDIDRVLVTGPTYPKISYGDKLIVEAKLEVPEPFETDSGRTFDYPHFLAKDGIGYVARRATVEHLASGEGNSLMAMFVKAKHAFVSSIERSVAEPASGLAAGVVLGVEGSLSKADEEAFRIASLIHIIVVSGYNITMAGNFVATLLSSFPPIVGSLGSVGGILSYILLTGASSTAVRAGIMACITVLATVTKRRYDVIRALMVAGLFMALHTPHIVLYDPSFQLSFLATWGLVKIAPLFEARLGWITERIGLREIVATTLGAQTAVTPLLLYQSGTTHTLSLLANIVVLPFMPVFMFASIAAGVAGFVSPYIALPFALLVELVSAHVFFVVKLMGIASDAIVDVGSIVPWMLVLIYAGLVVGVETFSGRGDNNESMD